MYLACHIHASIGLCLLSILDFVTGVMYALLRIVNCMILNLTHLEENIADLGVPLQSRPRDIQVMLPGQLNRRIGIRENPR